MCLRSISKIMFRCRRFFQLIREGTAPGIYSDHCRSNTPRSPANLDVKTGLNRFRIKWRTGQYLTPKRGAATQDHPKLPRVALGSRDFKAALTRCPIRGKVRVRVRFYHLGNLSFASKALFASKHPAPSKTMCFMKMQMPTNCPDRGQSHK